ncbi:helix-turn-helix transcriptional regulator [Aestuariibacter halophilus]|uniref:Helix-turn-helix transcriptional regulator n=1 Tax=Fluctibacter halophilus TaxID=226011 RepID=A0ABS8G9N1_9ALTE|nr:helix-turn-helix transcriptional regulator [Aestuariibacter halophilus]MCC2615916.1 helix-turn-helix transcriptional regulator [Aestuariibacter halophilus]
MMTITCQVIAATTSVDQYCAYNNKAEPSPMRTTACESRDQSPFAATLKKWRKARKFSQLELSLEAGISQRHLSFLESGRSRPGKDTIIQLTDALNMPLRDRNQMLKSAGFAALYKERALDDATMVSVKSALTMMLDHHEPYPALVVDRNWNLYMANDASNKLLGLIGEPDPSLLDDGKLNIYRLTFSNKGLRPFITNWPTIANPLLLRLQAEVSDDPQNRFLADLLQEVQSLAREHSYTAADISATVAPVLGISMQLGDVKLNLFSMISAFGTALDVTASELKVETFFPADEATKAFFQIK